MRVHGYVALNFIAVTLPYSLHSIGRTGIIYGHSPSAFFARLGRLRPSSTFMFLFLKNIFNIFFFLFPPLVSLSTPIL